MNPLPEFAEDSLQLQLARPGIDAVVSRFQSAHQKADTPVRAIHHQPAAEGSYLALPAEVDVRLRQALERRGIARLYGHQADAFAAIGESKNIVVVTPT